MILELVLILIIVGLIAGFIFIAKPLNIIGGIDTVLGGHQDSNFCPKNDQNKKCLKNCVDWTSLKTGANYFCSNDFGPGWVSESIGQGDCTIGFGKAICKKDPEQAEKKYMNNCVIWSDIDKNGDKFCSDDFGDGYVYTGEKEQANCTVGFGKGKCKYDSNQAGKKYMNNCVIWSDIDNNGDKFCNNDFGSGWKYTGEKDQGGCSVGFGKGKCKYDQNERNKTKSWKNCVDWLSIPTFGDSYCKNDFGNSYSYTGRGGEGCAFGWGKGYCNSN